MGCRGFGEDGETRNICRRWVGEALRFVHSLKEFHFIKKKEKKKKTATCEIRCP
jgi:hypothetical protein